MAKLSYQKLVTLQPKYELYQMDNEYSRRRAAGAHLSMFGACVLWGLMAPLGKDAMTSGIDGMTMVLLRVVGAAALFWMASLFGPKEYVPMKDRLRFAGAAIFGIMCNQCGFTIGLSLTSPTNASIMTTSMPIFAMLLAFLILHEPITWKKAGGVFIGCAGALMLILTSVTAQDGRVGDYRGDLLCICAQLSYAFYLSKFNPLVRRYHPITVNKWMFLWAAIMLSPALSWHAASTLQWHAISTTTWLEAGYVVFFGTFVSYILCINGQRTLRPTVVSIYNYVQPAVAVAVSIAIGQGTLRWTQGLAVVLVFTGVMLVTKSKSRRDMERADANK